MENTAHHDWSTFQKIAFRFSFLVFLLFIFIQNNGAYPFLDVLMQYPWGLLEIAIPWVGKHVLHLPYEITTFTNGSIDTTYDYVIVFSIFMVSALGTITWSVLHRDCKDYNRLYYWLTVAIRFYLGLMLVRYGITKVVKLQFSYPGLYKLTQNYGDSSPMGLAWTYLGFSYGYNLFMGIAELAAILLLFRRTMTFGAIITLVTTLNIMAVNYCYDIPAKTLSTALVLMALFLLSKDMSRLCRFFFTGEAVSLPVIKAPVFKNQDWRIAKYVLKFSVIGYTVIYGTISLWNIKQQYAKEARPKLYGLYHVDLFIVNKDTLAPGITNLRRWNQVVVEEEGFTRVRYMGDSAIGFLTQLDTVAQRIDFSIWRDTSFKASFQYDLPDPDQLNLSGVIGRDSVWVKTTRRVSDAKNFRLLKRGFRWINERPYNK